MGVAEGMFDFDLESKERSSLPTILDQNSYTFNWIPQRSESAAVAQSECQAGRGRAGAVEATG